MAILNPAERIFLTSVTRVSYANPFLPERIDYERDALGTEFDESHANWNLLGDDPETHQINTTKIAQRAYPIIAGFQEQLKKGVATTGPEIQLYEDTVLFLLFYNYAQKFKKSIIDPKKGRTYAYFEEFYDYWSFFFDIPGYKLPKKGRRPTFLPVPFKSAVPSIIFSGLSSDVRRWRQTCGPWCGRLYLPMTCAAIAASFIDAWVILPL